MQALTLCDSHNPALVGDTGRMYAIANSRWGVVCLLLASMMCTPVRADTISATAQSEMQILLADKAQPLAQYRKLDTGLRFALQRLRDSGAAAQLPRLRVLAPDARGRLQLDIALHDATASPDVVAWLLAQPAAQLVSATGSELRAWLHWQDVAALASFDSVRSVRRAMPALNGNLQAPGRSNAGAMLPKALNISAGVRTHRVDVARAALGLTGLGQKICVLSDSVDHLGAAQSSGDILVNVEILPGQSGLGEGFFGEGTAMLEIVHDLAPDARLGFATAFTGVASFAQNIRDLRLVAGCHVIVDDIFYFDESPFQDGPIAQAVNDVIADGALYFAASGNEGNAANGTSSVYQGNFVDGGALPALPGGSVNQFSVAGIGSSNQVRVLTNGFAAALFWSDPLGASGNDYDVFIMSPDLLHVLDASTELQDGDDDPFEITGLIFPDDRIVVWKAGAAAPRLLHLNGLRGRFNLGTDGQTKGHNAAAEAFGVAAVDVFTAAGGAFTGGAANPVEPFSSDGPRKMFFNANGTLLNPGNPSLLADGGVLRVKPDIAAADGVATATPGFSQFFGTSAAAPHAAAIAALLRQAAPSATPAQIRTALTSSALDIEAPGVDALSGAGIVMADAALASIGAVPVARLHRSDFVLSAVDGDSDAVAEPGETLDLSVRLNNTGAALASGITLTLSSITAGVEVLRVTTAYPDLAPNTSAFGTQKFRLRLAPAFPCGADIQLQLQANFTGGSPGIATLALAAITLPVGSAGVPFEQVYAGAAVPIPDGNLLGISVALAVSAPGMRISDIDLHFDGAKCSGDFLATGVGLQHTFVGDLDIRLQSPSGTSVRLVDRPRAGAGDNGGNHFCQTVFDDAASTALADAISSGEPFSGAFRGAAPLAGFSGENADGNWQLRLVDTAAGDSGQLRAFRLVLRPALCDLYVPVVLHADGFE